MTYKHYTLDLRSGDVVLFRNAFRPWTPMRYLSWIIRLVTRAKYNHVAVIVSNWDLLEINEALAGGIKSRPCEKYLHRHLTRIKVLRPVAGVAEAAFCRRANSRKGTPYDKWALLHHLWFRLSGRWVGSTAARSEGKMVCSEYAAWCYEFPQWWTYSAKELEAHPAFAVVFEEG